MGISTVPEGEGKELDRNESRSSDCAPPSGADTPDTKSSASPLSPSASSSSSSSSSAAYLSRIRRGGEFHGQPLEKAVRLSAEVVRGFGRGSKLLGIPTANMSKGDLGSAADSLPTGIYLGFAILEEEDREGGEGGGGQVGHGLPSLTVYKTVVSVGWNPYFANKEKTVEPHLIHDFGDRDFYGAHLHVVLCGYVRPELNFASLEDLILAIRADIDYAKEKLDEPQLQVNMRVLQDSLAGGGGGAAAAAAPR